MTEVTRADPIVTDALVQGSGVQSVKTTDGGVITSAQLSAGATGADTIVIAKASEAFDHAGGGEVDLVGDESAVVDLQLGLVKARYGYDAVAKVRMDFAPIRWLLGVIGKVRALRHSAAFRASGQPETGWEALVQAEPGKVSQALLRAPGNPGAMLAEISGDMVEWHSIDGVNRLFLPVRIDGQKWGAELRYLEGSK